MTLNPLSHPGATKLGKYFLKKKTKRLNQNHTLLTVPERGRLPVVVVVGEAGEAREAAFLALPLAFLLLPLLPPPTVLLEELQLAVYFLNSFPVPTEGCGHDQGALSQGKIPPLLRISHKQADTP